MSMTLEQLSLLTLEQLSDLVTNFPGNIITSRCGFCIRRGVDVPIQCGYGGVIIGYEAPHENDPCDPKVWLDFFIHDLDYKSVDHLRAVVPDWINHVGDKRIELMPPSSLAGHRSGLIVTMLVLQRLKELLPTRRLNDT